MRAPGIEMGVSSGGTGNLTLTPISGKPSFATVFGGSGTKIVEYVINDGNSMETGVGSLNLSTLVLTRTRVNTTWTGSVWDDTNPSALSIGTTATVMCDDMGWNHLPALTVGMIKTITNGDDAGSYPLNFSLTTGTLALTAQRLYYVPYHWGIGGEIDQAAFRVTTQAASQTCRIALYDVGSNGYPDKLICYFGDASVASQGVIKFGSGSFSSFYLPPGWYYAAVLSTGTPTLRAGTITYNGPVGLASGQSMPYVYRLVTHTTGSPYSFLTQETNTPLMISGVAIAPLISLRTR